MGTLTIRNLEDALKSRLRMRSAARNRSMEEEARQILPASLGDVYRDHNPRSVPFSMDPCRCRAPSCLAYCERRRP